MGIEECFLFSGFWKINEEEVIQTSFDCTGSPTVGVITHCCLTFGSVSWINLEWLILHPLSWSCVHKGVCVCVCAQSINLPLYSVSPLTPNSNKRNCCIHCCFGDNECNNDHPEQTSFLTNHLKWIIRYKWSSMYLVLYTIFSLST